MFLVFLNTSSNNLLSAYIIVLPDIIVVGICTFVRTWDGSQHVFDTFSNSKVELHILLP